jgi:hypothetical protein
MGLVKVMDMETNFYCQIKCLGIDFSITEWEKAFNIGIELGLSETQLSKLLEGEPCKNQCPDCACIVGERKIKTRMLITNMHTKMDIDYLMESYNKYKDKTGIKARSLMFKIEAWQGFYELLDSIK